jgi:hypothetical protein
MVVVVIFMTTVAADFIEAILASFIQFINNFIGLNTFFFLALHFRFWHAALHVIIVVVTIVFPFHRFIAVVVVVWLFTHTFVFGISALTAHLYTTSNVMFFSKTHEGFLIYTMEMVVKTLCFLAEI